MRYRLRTLMILLAVAPPLLALTFSHVNAYITEQRERREAKPLCILTVTPIIIITNEEEPLGIELEE